MLICVLRWCYNNFKNFDIRHAIITRFVCFFVQGLLFFVFYSKASWHPAKCPSRANHPKPTCGINNASTVNIIKSEANANTVESIAGKVGPIARVVIPGKNQSGEEMRFYEVPLINSIPRSKAITIATRVFDIFWESQWSEGKIASKVEKCFASLEKVFHLTHRLRFLEFWPCI